MDPLRTTVVVGGPGTGKTYHLLSVVEEALTSGVKPDRIAFLSFTKKAADEGRSRASERFGIPPERFPYFKTLHAFAFKHLNARRDRMFGWQHVHELGKILGLDFKGKEVMDGDVYGMNSADRLLFLDGLAKNTELPLKSIWNDACEDSVEWLELERFSRALDRFKVGRSLYDFNDLLEKFCKTRIEELPQLDLLIIDEAQDCSALQWRAIEMLASVAKQTYCGGDDRQGIFTWSGGDVDRFISLPGKQVTLQQSRRIPASVHRLAQGIAAKISRKRHQDFKARDVEGKINWLTTMEEADLSTGSWLLLARNGYMLDKLEDWCMSQGFSFNSINRDPLKSPALAAISVWERLRRGEYAAVGQFLDVVKFMTSEQVSAALVKELKASDPAEQKTMQELLSGGLRTDAIWHESLVKISSKERDFFIAARRRNEPLLKKPRIKISTIHASKGGEEDHVLLLTDMSSRCVQNMERDEDSEHRVFYVGATRCRESLNIVLPRTRLFYEI